MNTRRRMRGVGLIEVLVAMVIIAVGLLGLLSLESHANHAEMESYQRAQALILMMDMVNRIKANSAYAGCYVLSNTSYANLGVDANDNDISFSNTNCNSIADGDMSAWNALLQGASETMTVSGVTNNVGAMIDARGCISVVNATLNQYKVEVAWQGLSDTAAPPVADVCGKDLYTDSTGNADEKMRRDVSYIFNAP